MQPKFSVGLGPFGGCADRFCPGGYRESPSLRQRVELAAQVEELDGLELHYPIMFEDIDVSKWKDILKAHNWGCSIVSVAVWHDKEWGKGSLSSPSPDTRRKAVEFIKKGMDISAQLAAYKINLWLGQDGHDYPFQADYKNMWEQFIDGLTECAQHNPEVKICLEYKIKEPRTHIAVGTVGKLLWLSNKVGLPNVGANLDVGHALEAYENPAESAVMLYKDNKLFHLHFDDTYGDWDWDMLAGSVHFWELLELCFWLKELGYDGWYSLDLFPAREDPVKVVELSIKNIKDMIELAQRLDRATVLAHLKKHDYISMLTLIRESICG